MQLSTKKIVFHLIPDNDGNYIIEVTDLNGEVYGYVLANGIEQALEAVKTTVNDGEGTIDLDSLFGGN